MAGASPAHTHNLNVVAILDRRLNDTDNKVEDLEKLYAKMCEENDIEYKFRLKIHDGQPELYDPQLRKFKNSGLSIKE